MDSMNHDFNSRLGSHSEDRLCVLSERTTPQEAEVLGSFVGKDNVLSLPEKVLIGLTVKESSE